MDQFYRNLTNPTNRSHLFKKLEVRKNLRLFSGFTFGRDSVEFEKKREMISKLTKTELSDVCTVFNVERSGSKEEQIERVLNFCLKPIETGLKLATKGKKRSSKKAGKKKSKSTSKTASKSTKAKTSKSAEGEEDQESNESEQSDQENDDSDQDDDEEQDEEGSDAENKDESMEVEEEESSEAQESPESESESEEEEDVIKNHF